MSNWAPSRPEGPDVAPTPDGLGELEAILAESVFGAVRSGLVQCTTAEAGDVRWRLAPWPYWCPVCAEMSMLRSDGSCGRCTDADHLDGEQGEWGPAADR
jgi:hypothetical protein